MKIGGATRALPVADAARGASGSGRCATQLHRQQGAHRAPQQGSSILLPHAATLYNEAASFFSDFTERMRSVVLFSTFFSWSSGTMWASSPQHPTRILSENRVSSAASHTDCALRLLQSISSIAVCGLRLNTVRCMPYRPHPLWFSA